MRYPRDQTLTYDQLLPILKLALPSDEPFVRFGRIILNAVSGHVRSRAPQRLTGVGVCAGFVFRHPGAMCSLSLHYSWLRCSFRSDLSKSVCRYFLVATPAPTALVKKSARQFLECRGECWPTVLIRALMQCGARAWKFLHSVALHLRVMKKNRFVRISSFKKIQQR